MKEGLFSSNICMEIRGSQWEGNGGCEGPGKEVYSLLFFEKKCCDQKSLWKTILTYASRGRVHKGRGGESGSRCMEQGGQRLHLQLQKGNRIYQKWARLWSFKVDPQGCICFIKLSPLHRQHCSLGTKCLITWAYGEFFLFKTTIVWY